MLGLKWIRPRTYLGSPSSSQCAKKKHFRVLGFPWSRKHLWRTSVMSPPLALPGEAQPGWYIKRHLAASCSNLLFPPSEMDKSLLLGLPVLLCCFQGESPCGWQLERCVQDVGMGRGTSHGTSHDRGSLMRVIGNRSCHSNAMTFTHNASHPWNLQQNLSLLAEENSRL